MDFSRPPIPPVTLEELKSKLRLMLGATTRDTKLEYTVVEISQFKIIGIYTRFGDMSSFTIDLMSGIPRRFIDHDLSSVLIRIKEDFERFSRTSYKYTSPFEHHTRQTMFYSLVQIHFRILETVQSATAQVPDIFTQLNQPQNLFQPQTSPELAPLVSPPLPFQFLPPLHPISQGQQAPQQNTKDQSVSSLQEALGFLSSPPKKRRSETFTKSESTK